ncbi:transcriptional regulator [Clostridia bacterium]|nr:transcriptional regulator [Clostridia bacterium]
MLITPIPENVAFFSALASDVRLKIIQLLAEEELNIKELATKIGVSSPIMMKHIKLLESAGFLSSRLVKRKGSTSRVCTLVFAEYRLMLDFRRRGLPSVYQFSIPVGQYCDIEGTPTCGLATDINVIGVRDDPRIFWESERSNAQLLWFSQGFVEYRAPNYLSKEQHLVEVELSFEIASEAPDFADDWPSDITFYLNGIKLFTWTSPGDYGVKRGILTPDWWPSNQYGLLKTIRVTEVGIMLDGEKVSDVTLAQVVSNMNQYWNMRFEVSADAKNVGGLTLFGKHFGNHAQDISMRIFYQKNGTSL